MEPDKLLKQATEKKKAGDLESAIGLLRDAYKKISKSQIAYPVNTFLRLPAYLQEAGKGDEAWRELNNLLTNGYPSQLNDPQIIPMDHSAIYDAMRLFLQREGKSESAVKFGVLSYVSWSVGLNRQGRTDEVQKYASFDSIESTVTKLLRKAKKEDMVKRVIAIVEDHMKKLPNIKLGELAQEIDDIIIK